MAKTFYGDEIITEAQIIPNLTEFEWSQCNQFALKCLSTDVSTKENLEKLAQHLNANQNETIQYLDKLISFVSKQNQALSAFIANLTIWPNQHGDFCEKKALKKDDGIDSELKEICSFLTKEDWCSKLLLVHDKFTKTQALFDDNETESPKAICDEINNALKDYKDDHRDYNFVQAVRLLFDWCKSKPEKVCKELLPYFHQKKAQLFLDICEDQGINNCIFDLVQLEPEKLRALAKLGNTSGILESDMNLFVENYEDLRILEELKAKQADAESASEVLEMLEQLGLDRKSLQNILNVQTSRQSVTRGGNCSSINLGRIYPQVIGFDDNDEVVDVGLRGEEFVYRKLVAKFGDDRVKWMNQDGEARHPYDFQVLEENLQEVAYYIDAKSSSKGEHSDGNIFFSISNAQWDFLKECDNYYIAKVFRATSERPNLKLIKIDLKDELV